MKKIIPIGPYHPLQDEPEFFKLYVEGENVVDIDIEIGYNHRGVEKLSETKHYDQVTFLVERICGICSTSHPFAYVNAMENLLGLEVPLRAKCIRTIVGELERIHSHLLWLGLAGHFIGYNTVWMWSWKYRENVCDILELISGNRQHYSMFKIGGVRKDIPQDLIPEVEKLCTNLVAVIDMFKGAVMDDPVIQARLKGVGVLTKEDAINYCVVGPTARASGVDIDVRRDDPYAAYGMIKFNVIVLQNGDVFDKAVVRILEMYESIKIIQQCLDILKTEKGEIEIKIHFIPKGEGLGRHEAPRGEVFHFIKSDGSNRPVRHKIRAPSYMNVASNKVAAVGQTVSDAAITLAAVDPCYCCTERAVILDRNDNIIYRYNDLIKLSQQKTEGLIKKLVKQK